VDFEPRDLPLDALTETGYTGKADFEQLGNALRRVFEPGGGTIRKAVGHPEAPLMSDSFVTRDPARLAGAARLRAGKITDEEFYFARHVLLVAYADYAMNRHSYAALAPEGHRDMYDEVTAERALNEACLSGVVKCLATRRSASPGRVWIAAHLPPAAQ